MQKISLAGCLIFNSDGKLLLLHRNTSKRVQWEISGGKIEENENPEDTAIREIQEEIGVTVSIDRLIGTKEFEEDGFFMDYNWFVAIIKEGVPQVMETEKFDKLEFHDWRTLTKLRNELSANTKNLLLHYESGLLKI